MKHVAAMLVFWCVAATVGAADRLPANEPRTPYHAQPHKPTLPVKIHALVPADIAPGAPVTFNVDVTSALDDGELELTFVALDSLSVRAPTQAVTLSLSPHGLNTTQPVTVLAPQDGHYSLTVRIRHLTNGKARSVSRAITFHVGDRSRAANKSLQLPAGAEPGVVSLPATESVRR